MDGKLINSDHIVSICVQRDQAGCKDSPCCLLVAECVGRLSAILGSGYSSEKEAFMDQELIFLALKRRESTFALQPEKTKLEI